jgi:hypothetical protein
VRRRLFDRLISLVVPMERIRCASALCGWEGLVRRGTLGSFGRARRKYYRVGAVEHARAPAKAEAPLHEPISESRL